MVDLLSYCSFHPELQRLWYVLSCVWDGACKCRCGFIVSVFCSWCDGSSDRSLMLDPLSYFSFHPVLHDWCNKGCGLCYPVCGRVHIKEP